MSQLNHVLAKRQPGSIFKPFVYAAALDTAVEGGPRILTASTMVVDRAHHLLVRRQALRAEQLRTQVLRRRHAARSAGPFAECGHRESGRDGGLRRGGGHGQPRRHELQDPADAGSGAGRLRNHSARSGGRVHDVRQPGRLREADFLATGSRRRTARCSTRTRSKRSRCSIRGLPT